MALVHLRFFQKNIIYRIPKVGTELSLCTIPYSELPFVYSVLELIIGIPGNKDFVIEHSLFVIEQPSFVN